MKRISYVTVLVSFLGYAFAPQAHAGGFDFPGQGTVPMGRGGAFAARADDPMALAYNPAGLTRLSGPQLMVNASLASLHACATRAGTAVPHFPASYSGVERSRFGTTLDPDGTETPETSFLAEAFPEVCNSAAPTIGAQLVFGMPINDRLAIGVGLLTPFGIGHLQYGNEDGSINTANGLRPSPLRYMLGTQNALALFPTVGAGFRVTNWLSVGASLQWGMAFLKFRNWVVANPGELPEEDIRADTDVKDAFIPGVILGVLATPHENLDVSLGFRYGDSIRAAGSVDLTYGDFGSGSPNSSVATKTHYGDVTFRIPQPMSLTLGVRYSDRITPRRRIGEPVDPNVPQDSLATERWDVELDAAYEMNSAVDKFVLTFPEARPPLGIVGFDGTTMTNSSVPIPPVINLYHRWKNQLSLRLGGDWNVIQNRLAIRAGVSFETRGQDTRYTQLDVFPYQRIGLHLGGTVRFGRVDVTAAAVYFIQESISTPLASDYGTSYMGTEQATGGQYRQVAAAGLDGLGYSVNPGKYETGLFAFSLGANYHF